MHRKIEMSADESGVNSSPEVRLNLGVSLPFALAPPTIQSRGQGSCPTVAWLFRPDNSRGVVVGSSPESAVAADVDPQVAAIASGGYVTSLRYSALMGI